MRTDNHTYTKTSIYLRDDIKEAISNLNSHGNQTSFINETLAQALENIEREILRQDLLKSLKAIKPVRRKETARQTLERLRKEREEQIFRNLKSTKKTKKL